MLEKENENIPHKMLSTKTNKDVKKLLRKGQSLKTVSFFWNILAQNPPYISIN